MYHLFRIGMTAESIRLKKNSCEISANRTHIRYPSLPMSKQHLSTELRPVEAPHAVEIIKLHDVAVFFGKSKTHDCCEMRRAARQEKRLTLTRSMVAWVKRNLPFTDSKAVRPGLLQTDKQRMIRDIVKPIHVVTRRLKHQAASLNFDYEY